MKLLRGIAREFVGWIELFVTFYPDTRIGLELRKAYYARKMKGRLGRNARISRGCIIYVAAPLEIGDNFVIGSYAVVAPNDSFGIIIGNNVGIAERAYIRGGNHDYSDPARPIMEQGHVARKITDERRRDASIIIGDDVWIGAGCFILSGAKIGRGAVIGAGSVVATAIPEYAIALGNPVRVVASRKVMSFSKKYQRFP
jgi:acetyltransferase-like isoleucine patch superfamily enzyme